MVTTFTYKPSMVRIDARKFRVIDARKFRVIVVTDPPTNSHTQPTRQDRLQYIAQHLARSVTILENRHSSSAVPG